MGLLTLFSGFQPVLLLPAFLLFEPPDVSLSLFRHLVLPSHSRLFLAPSFSLRPYLFCPLLILSSRQFNPHLLFSLPFLQAGILSAASGAEMADVEQMKKIVPFITREVTFWLGCLRFGAGSMHRI